MIVSNLLNHPSEDIETEVVTDEDMMSFVLGLHEESADVAAKEED